MAGIILILLRTLFTGIYLKIDKTDELNNMKLALTLQKLI